MEKIRILLLEDNPGDALLLKETLRDVTSFAHEVMLADTLREGARLLREAPFDILLLDLMLSDSRGMDTVIAARREAPDIPIVVMTSLADEAQGIEAIRLGVQDYLVKGHADVHLLGRVIRYAIEHKRVQLEIQKANNELELRVRQRTAELEQTLVALQEEFDERIATSQTAQVSQDRFKSTEKDAIRVGRELQRTLANRLEETMDLAAGLARDASAEDRPARVDLLCRHLRTALAQTYALSRMLTPLPIALPELPQRLRQFAGDVMVLYGAEDGLEVVVNAGDLPVFRLPGAVAATGRMAEHLFQVAREAVMNAIEHGQARQIEIALDQLHGKLRLVVRDNGAGLPQDFDPAKGLGIRIARDRVKAMGGEFHIGPGKEGGVEVCTSVPLSVSQAA